MGKKSRRIKQEEAIKEKTISYHSKDCEHIPLEKIARGHYFCTDCGVILNVMLTTQFGLEQSLEHYGEIFLGIKDKMKQIKKAKKKREGLEKEQERRAIEEYKDEQKAKESN